VLLTALAAMMAAATALSGVAQAAPISGKADVQCFKLARQTLGTGVNPSDYTFDGGTEGPDPFTGTAGTADVFCGFGGNDSIATLEEGDIFFGGAGEEFVHDNYGTYYGQEDRDDAYYNAPGAAFYGGEGFDFVLFNDGGIFVE
jgi:Ca2+-binding RTX toxin-like protein